MTSISRSQLLPLVLISSIIITGCLGQENPLQFTRNMDGEEISETRSAGDVVYRLQGTSSNEGDITFGITSDYFTVADPTSGDVSLTQRLDFEAQPEVEVRVWMRQGSDYLEERATISVRDRDDEAPEFSESSYSVIVSEDTVVNTVVLSGITITDSDAVNTGIFVTCLSPTDQNAVNPCDYFSLVSSLTSNSIWMGDLVLRSSLNYESIQSFSLTAYARDNSGVLGQETRQSISIQVLDVQDTPPVFTSSPNAIVIENSPANTLVMPITVRDGDTADAREVRLELLSNPNDAFFLDDRTGELYTAQTLGRGVLTPQIRACEAFNATHAYTGINECTVVELRITVSDINNNAPMFSQQDYRVDDVNENIEDNSPIATIMVSDADEGSNAMFELLLLNDNDTFAVMPVRGTGSLTASVYVINSDNIDYEGGRIEYNLRLEAVETNTEERLSSFAYVDVFIMDVNDNPPVFAEDMYTANVMETATEGTPIITITASDEDTDPRFGRESIRYKLVGNGADRFRVDSRTGEITVRRCSSPGAGNCLDAERQSVYDLQFYAGDSYGEGFITIIPVQINVGNANDNPPRFSQDEYVAFILENERVPFQPDPPFKVEATDGDVTDELRFSILSGNPGVWQIGETSGEITAIDPVDFEAIPGDEDHYRMTVEVNDGNTADTATVIIFVTDVNEHAPEFIPREGLYEQFISEDTAPGTLVQAVSATDDDSQTRPNGMITYRITSGSVGKFDMDQSTGEVTVAPSATFDFDVQKLYNMTILALDQGQPQQSADATLWVHIRDANNKSPFFQPSTVRETVPEDASLGTLVTRMRATDPDLDAQLVYYLENPRSAYDPNDNLVDPDTVPNFNYLFNIDQQSGVVRVNSTLDYSTIARYHTTVKAVDNAGGADQTATANLIITITQVNTDPPEFALPWMPTRPVIDVTAREGQPPGSYVTTLVATDPEGVSEYRIVSDPGEFFDIDPTGVVTVQRPVDYETQDQLTFRAIAIDNGEPQLTSTATVIVHVRNINDFTPEFVETLYETELTENAPGGTVVTQVLARDGDRNGPDDEDYGTVMYSMNDPQNRFTINNVTGQITVVDGAVLDREVEPIITLTVTAYDSPKYNETRLYSQASVYVTLLDENDQDPRFSQNLYNAVIFENVPALTSVIEVAANDEDQANTPNTELTFFESAGDELGMFEIQPSTGLITTRNDTIRGLSGEYTLTIGVTDRGTPAPRTGSAQVLISVLVTNNQAPEWIIPDVNNFVAELLEEQQPDRIVIDVEAEDDDQGRNGEVMYGFYDNNFFVNQTEEFSINSVTGVISARQTFDREEQSSYTLLLVARDKGDPFYESTRYLIVRIADIDDNNPEFPGYYNCCSIPFTIYLNETRAFDPPSEIGTIMAVDKDEGQAAEVTYTIIDGNAEEKFALHSNTGLLTLKKQLHYEQTNFFELTVTATDGSDLRPDTLPPQCRCDSLSVIKIYIHVIDYNEHPPTWASQHTACIMVDAEIGTLVTVLEAIDRDTGTSDNVTYEFETFRMGKRRGNTEPAPNTSFTIGEDNGTVYSNTLMDKYEEHYFSIDVRADDNGGDDGGFNSTTELLVWVTDDTDEVTMVFDRRPSEIQQELDEIIQRISELTDNGIVCINDLRFHVTDDNVVRRSWTDLTFHVIKNSTYVVMDPDKVADKIKRNDRFLAAYGIRRVYASYDEWDGFKTAAVWAAIGIILFLLLLLLLLLFCCCWCLGCWREARPVWIGTINPLWGMKEEEDQELTMRIKEWEGIESTPVVSAGHFTNAAYEADTLDAGGLLTKSETHWQYESHQMQSNGSVVGAGAGSSLHAAGAGSSLHAGAGSHAMAATEATELRIEAPLESASVASMASMASSLPRRQRTAATMTDDEASEVGSALQSRSITNFGATLTRSGVAVERIIGDTGSSLHGSDVVDLTRLPSVSMVPGGSSSHVTSSHVERSYHASTLPMPATRSYMVESNEIFHDISAPAEAHSDGGFIAPLDSQYQGEIRVQGGSLGGSPRGMRKTYVERTETTEYLD